MNNPTVKEILAPKNKRENTSRPFISVPSKNNRPSLFTPNKCFEQGIMPNNLYSSPLTKGFIKNGVPDCPPEPIDTLIVKPSQNGNFEAVWYQNDSNEVRLYYSTNKPRYNFGEVVSLLNLEKEMYPLPLLPLSNHTSQNLKANEKGASFKYNGKDVWYIAAVVVKSGSAVFGSLARAVNGETVNIKAVRPVNGQINIYIDAPVNATGFVVLYRFDQLPTDIGDVKTIERTMHGHGNQLTIDRVCGKRIIG